MKKLSISDFNGRVISFRKNILCDPDVIPRFAEFTSLSPNTIIGISFLASGDEESLPPIDSYVHVIWINGKGIEVFRRYKIKNLKLTKKNPSEKLKNIVIGKIKFYHTDEKYMTNLSYLEAMYNLNKIKVEE